MKTENTGVNPLITNMENFFDDSEAIAARDTRRRRAVAGLAAFLLHLAKASFLIYSAYHGINASRHFAGAGGLGVVSQAVGIVIVEAVLAGLFLAFITGRLVGDNQKVAAAVVYVIGFILAGTGIVADSQANAGQMLTPAIAFYLRWGLPLAPAIMAAGAVVVYIFSPEQNQRSEQAAATLEQENARFKAAIAGQYAELEAQKIAANLQLNGKMAFARAMAEAYSDPSVQAAITRRAVENLPALLDTAGLPLGDVDLASLTRAMVARRPFRTYDAADLDDLVGGENQAQRPASKNGASAKTAQT